MKKILRLIILTSILGASYSTLAFAVLIKGRISYVVLVDKEKKVVNKNIEQQSVKNIDPFTVTKSQLRAAVSQQIDVPQDKFDLVVFAARLSDLSEELFREAVEENETFAVVNAKHTESPSVK